MIKIICVGKIKENFYKEAIKEYQKRLTKYTKLEIIEIEDESIAEKAKKIEGTKIQSKIKENDYVVTMEIEGMQNLKTFGKGIDSIEFPSLPTLSLANCSNFKWIDNCQDGCISDEYSLH